LIAEFYFFQLPMLLKFCW